MPGGYLPTMRDARYSGGIPSPLDLWQERHEDRVRLACSISGDFRWSAKEIDNAQILKYLDWSNSQKPAPMNPEKLLDHEES